MADKSHSNVTGFFKSSKIWFKGIFLIKRYLFVGSHRPYMFPIPKSQNRFDLMRSFLLKRFTKLVKINLRRSKAKHSHLSNFPFSFCLNLYQLNILHFVKPFRIKTFKKSIKIDTKACSNEQIISSDLKPEVDESLNITCRKMMITNCITKSYRFKMFDSLFLKIPDTETEILKPHYIHVYKVFG